MLLEACLPYVLSGSISHSGGVSLVDLNHEAFRLRDFTTLCSSAIGLKLGTVPIGAISC